MDAAKKSFVILDVDTGNDDAWAIISLLRAEEKCDYKVLAITCCNGNTTVEHSTLNTLMVLETCKRMDVSLLPAFSGIFRRNMKILKNFLLSFIVGFSLSFKLENRQAKITK
jgi:inosine-uridine nucleoside N-ribohydrolase